MVRLMDAKALAQEMLELLKRITKPPWVAWGSAGSQVRDVSVDIVAIVKAIESVPVLAGEVLRLMKLQETATPEPMFMGFPDRWYESPGPKWRCINGHVRTMYLKSEALHSDVCLVCQGQIWLTAPEDTER